MISPVEVVLWPLLGGLGLLVLLTAQPIGRPRPSLGARLAALHPDIPRQEPEATAFANPTLERLLVPPLRAAGSLGLRLAELLGVPTPIGWPGGCGWPARPAVRRCMSGRRSSAAWSAWGCCPRSTSSTSPRLAAGPPGSGSGLGSPGS